MATTWAEMVEEQKKLGRKAAEMLEDVVNKYDSTAADAFIKQVVEDFHRTNQQSTMRLFIKLCEKWAENFVDGRFDGRNEGTVRLALQITDLVEREEPRIGMV